MIDPSLKFTLYWTSIWNDAITSCPAHFKAAFCWLAAPQKLKVPCWNAWAFGSKGFLVPTQTSLFETLVTFKDEHPLSHKKKRISIIGPLYIKVYHVLLYWFAVFYCCTNTLWCNVASSSSTKTNSCACFDSRAVAELSVKSEKNVSKSFCKDRNFKTNTGFSLKAATVFLDITWI